MSNPEITNKKSLLQVNQSDEQNQRMLKLIQQRSDLPARNKSNVERHDYIVKEYDRGEETLNDQFDLYMGKALEKDMTPHSQELLEEFRKKELNRRMNREKHLIREGIGLPTI